MTAAEYTTSEAVLQVADIRKEYRQRSGTAGQRTVQAVNGVSFSLHAGETIALVGESGCGKSSLANAVLRLDPPTAGEVELLGQKMSTASRRQLRDMRREIQVVFQDPYASLNGRMRVRDLVGEPLRVHYPRMDKTQRTRRIAEVLEKVGLTETDATRWPHEFSGGQRQRIGIARALVVQPRVVVCDEPLSALDVSVQAKVLNLLMDLQKSEQVAYIFITHDLRVVRQVAHRVAVMYLGRIAETGPTADVLQHPRHPYTRVLIDSVPGDRLLPGDRMRAEGDVPSAERIPPGCPFHPRCPVRRPQRCDTEMPEITAIGPDRHLTCHYPLQPAEHSRDQEVTT